MSRNYKIHDPNGPGGIAIGGVEWLDVVMGHRNSKGLILTQEERAHLMRTRSL